MNHYQKLLHKYTQKYVINQFKIYPRGYINKSDTDEDFSLQVTYLLYVVKL